ncbi:MAG: hypothetical protein WCY41_04890 [Candidatus Micrarchaeia archaeon]
MDKVAVALFTLVILACIIGAAYLFSINEGLAAKLDALNRTSSQKLSQAQSQYAALNSKYLSTQQELSAASEQLKAEQARLADASAQLSITESELNESRASLAGQQQKVDALRGELSTLETTINDSIAWFRSNAYMPENYTWTTDIFMSRMMSDCTYGGALNLACISHLMENTAFSIHYREDIAAGSEDHLQSVKETIGLGWGDCEDYALIFKAILNSARKENASLDVVAWQPAESGEFRVYPTDPSDDGRAVWVYANAKAAPMGSPSHAYVVCYSVDEASGHCTVALSDADVQSSSQVPLLDGAYVFEPQSGRYMGKLGESLSICTHSGCKQQGGKVWLVISDADLYMYGENGWRGYADYLSRVEGARSSLPS